LAFKVSDKNNQNLLIWNYFQKNKRWGLMMMMMTTTTNNTETIYKEREGGEKKSCLPSNIPHTLVSQV